MKKLFSKPNAPNAAKFWFFAAYFVILTVERVISLVVCFAGDMSKLDFLDFYMMAMTILAIFGSYIFVFVKLSGVMRQINGENPDNDEADNDNVFGDLAIAAGILLVGGMLHTNGSIPVMQFISYGMILISMAIHTAQNVRLHRDGDRRWLSFAYTVAYSMAIPVVYHTSMDIAGLFIPVEIIVSLGTVLLFTLMLRRFYLEGAESNFSLPAFIVALLGDFLVLMLRWTEEINTFVLIFICVTTVLWFAGNVLCIKRR